MNMTIWFSFVGTSFVFGLVPGPSVCFTIAHALKHGARRTCATIFGQLMANCSQIIVVLFGLSGILEQSVIFFQGIKLSGAMYLIYLGCRQWTSSRPSLNSGHESDIKSPCRDFRDGFIVCGTNPKAILYYAALLPQFVLPGPDEKIQLVILSITSVMIAALVLGMYTFLAARARVWFDKKKFWLIQNRFSGILMIGAGITLSLISRK